MEELDAVRGASSNMQQHTHSLIGSLSTLSIALGDNMPPQGGEAFAEQQETLGGLQPCKAFGAHEGIGMAGR